MKHTRSPIALASAAARLPKYALPCCPRRPLSQSRHSRCLGQTGDRFRQNIYERAADHALKLAPESLRRLQFRCCISRRYGEWAVFLSTAESQNMQPRQSRCMHLTVSSSSQFYRRALNRQIAVSSESACWPTTSNHHARRCKDNTTNFVLYAVPRSTYTATSAVVSAVSSPDCPNPWTGFPSYRAIRCSRYRVN